ncbi:hypothetical protein K438DRAFT_1847783 [Mycena galopus ATCC 62051]|nr:hypothetical protein K438DRAFT_1847783 [Mycena galopus ATCC 62051]
MLSNLALDRARIALLESEISALENSIVALKNERQSVQARLSAYVYPVLTLPNEVVSQIFVHTLPPYPLPSSLWGSSSPTFLGQICQKWRAIAFSTPMLWRAPSFFVSSIWTPRDLSLALNRGVALFETWLTRSGSCPLSIHLKDARSSGSLVDLNPFVEIIVLHFTHLEHLELSVGDEAVDPKNLASGPPSMPILRSLKLGSWSVADCTPAANFLNAPQLRSVHITRSSFPPHLLLPWSQLTSLVLEGVSAQKSAAVLNQTTSLVNCRLRFSLPLDVPEDMVDPLNHLQSLEIDSESMAFLSQLTLPTLRSIKITRLEIRDVWRLDTLDNLLCRWGCNLEKLHIIAKRSSDSTFGPSSSLAKCRAKFPSIPTLLVEEF